MIGLARVGVTALFLLVIGCKEHRATSLASHAPLAPEKAPFDDRQRYVSPSDLVILFGREKRLASADPASDPLAPVAVTFAPPASTPTETTMKLRPAVDRDLADLLIDLSLQNEGADRRVPILDASLYPFSAVGVFANGCSGTLIGSRHVLTAGHCVYNVVTQQWYRQLTFMPGRNGKAGRRISAVKAQTVRGWQEQHDWRYDFAVVELAEDVGNVVGTFVIQATSDTEFGETIASLVSYPNDKEEGTQWYSACALVPNATQQIEHSCLFEMGASGAGLYRLVDGKPALFAIHSHEGPSGRSVATRLSEDVIRLLDRWTISP